MTTEAAPDHRTDLTLTEAEIRALQFIADGDSHSRAAWQLGISERTYRRLLSDAAKKLHAINTTNAVAIGVARGLIVARIQPRRPR